MPITVGIVAVVASPGPAPRSYIPTIAAARLVVAVLPLLAARGKLAR